MRLFTLVVAALALAGGASGAAGAAETGWVAAPFDLAHWELEGSDIGLATYLGVPALRIHQGSAMLRGSDIGTGAIEYDVAFHAEPAFPGVHFRARDDGDWDYFYLRVHKSGGWDSNQYMPIVAGAATWQIYSGAEFSSKETYKLGAWNHIRIELYEHSADVFINGARSLRIPQLKSSSTHGFLALDSAPARGNTTGQVLYANFRYRSGPNATPADMPAPNTVSPAGLIRRWQVSEALSDEDSARRAATTDWSGVRWTSLPVESHGVANLARAALRAGAKHFAIARFEVGAERAATKMLNLGYSDIARVYVNGELLYRGDNSQYSRDPGFLGIVGLHETLAVRLRQGRNDIVFVVEEDSGGWGAEAQFADPAGLTSSAFDLAS
jgi:hypothetical protein